MLQKSSMEKSDRFKTRWINWKHNYRDRSLIGVLQLHKQMMKEHQQVNQLRVVVTLPEYVLESEYADKFPYRRTAVVDLSEYFQEKPTVDELRTRANQYMKDNLTGLLTVSLTVSFYWFSKILKKIKILQVRLFI